MTGNCHVRFGGGRLEKCRSESKGNSPTAYPTWLNSRNGHRYAHMGDVPPVERDRAKARIADFVQDEFRGMLLFTEVTDSSSGGLRVVTRTPHGNLFGYVQRDHELAVIRYDQWRIAWATAVDGNVLAVLEPVTA